MDVGPCVTFLPGYEPAKGRPVGTLIPVVPHAVAGRLEYCGKHKKKTTGPLGD